MIAAFAIGLALAAPDLRRRRPQAYAPSAATPPVGEKQDSPAPTGAGQDSLAPTDDGETPLAPMSERQDPVTPVGEDASSLPPRVVTIDVRPDQAPAGTEYPQRQAAVSPSAGGAGGDAAPRAVGYASIPALGPRSELAEQERQIRAACERHGLELVRMMQDVERVTRGQDSRPGLELAFETIAEGEASVLVVAEMARLSRSAVDLGDIVTQFEHAAARLIAVDPELDTATPEGRLAARALRTAGQVEERRAGERGRPVPTGARRTAPIGDRRFGDHSTISGRRTGPQEEER
jgi:hypothetical protein